MLMTNGLTKRPLVITRYIILGDLIFIKRRYSGIVEVIGKYVLSTELSTLIFTKNFLELIDTCLQDSNTDAVVF